MKMQVVHWDPNLTVTIQNDAFWPIIDEILKISATLSTWTSLVTLSTNLETVLSQGHRAETPLRLFL